MADAVSVGAEPRLADELAAVGHVAERREKHRHVSHRGVLVVRHVQDTIGYRRMCAHNAPTSIRMFIFFSLSPPPPLSPATPSRRVGVSAPTVIF